MHDELTAVDIQKMEEEIAYRVGVLGPKLLEELSRARELGDLSENAEYKEAKSAHRRNQGRVNYLKRMIRTAKIIEVSSAADRVGLFDYVVIRNETMGGEKRIQIVTTLRQNALEGFVSKESPLGSALMGRRVGERVTVQVNPTRSFEVTVLSIEKGEDNKDLPISKF